MYLSKPIAFNQLETEILHTTETVVIDIEDGRVLLQSTFPTHLMSSQDMQDMLAGFPDSAYLFSVDQPNCAITMY